MRRTADVMDVILLKFLLELRHAPPIGILPPVVGQHLLRRPELACRLTIGLHHVLAGLTPIHPEPRDVSRVIVDEPDDVGHLPKDREVCNVRLPHLVRLRRLESPFRWFRFLPRLHLRQRRRGALQVPAHRLRTRLQKEKPAQDLRYPLAPVFGILLLQGDDLIFDRHWKF